MEPIKPFSAEQDRLSEPANPSSASSSTATQTIEPLSPTVVVPSRSPLRWLWLLLGVGLIGGSIAIWRGIARPPAAPAVAQQQGPSPRAVETTTLQVGNGAQKVELLGQVVASQQATVRAQTDGVVEQILVNTGDRVSVGQTIAILDQSDENLAVAEANAQLAQERSNLARLKTGTRPEIIAQRNATVAAAKAREKETQDNLQRLEKLVKAGAIAERALVEARTAVDNAKGERLVAEATLAEAVAGPIQEEIEAQEANVAAAQAGLNQSQLAMKRTQIVASTGGVVQNRAVSTGDFVRSADAIVTLVSGDRLDVVLELPEELGGQVQSGTAVTLLTKSLPQWQEKATITTVSPITEAGSRRQRVRIQLNNPPAKLLPGMSILGKLDLPAKSSGFVVSRDVLTRRQDQWLVFTIADNKAKPVKVNMVADMGATVLISSPDLKAGEQIVSRGGDGLNEGMSVKVISQ
jgi:HlyD family secretion protein